MHLFGWCLFVHCVVIIIWHQSPSTVSIHVPCHLATKRGLYPVCYLLVGQRQIKRERVRFRSPDQIHSYGLWICLWQSVRVTFRWRDIKEWNAVRPGRAGAQQPRARGGGGQEEWVGERGWGRERSQWIACLFATQPIWSSSHTVNDGLALSCSKFRHVPWVG